MHEVALAFFWHQHQPYYPDDVARENPMPWVRLHGTKDYWGMAMLLKEAPELHATINLVPSLLQQLSAYTDGGHQDTHQRVSRLPADGLSEDDLYYLLDNFFMVHPDQMIRPFPRYHELYKKRGLSVDSAEKARKRFNKKDIIDLQCWSNLVWIHPLAFEHDAELAEFRAKGRGWTEKEKQWLLDKQMELLRQVVPLHRELMERGQVELTTTPFYHPILPLLWDKRLARRAMPNVMLPKHLEGYAEDAREHVRRAVEFHEKLFGQKPRGMWPSEGSVCQGVIPAIAEAGIQWIGTDEEILSCSTDGWVSRDGNGYLRNPEMLYRPWRVEEQGKIAANRLPRPRHERPDRLPLSALRAGPRRGRFHRQAGGHRQRHRRQRRPSAHAGEHHSRRRELLGILSRTPAWISCAACIAGWCSIRRSSRCAIGDYLARYPATDKLGHLFPGSWIQHNFGIWIGHPECNRAWDAAVRDAAVAAGASRRGNRSRPTRSPGRGKNCTSPRGATGSGGSATATAAPGRPVRSALPQTPAKRLHGAGRTAADRIGPARSARGIATRKSTPSRPAC